MKYRIVDVNENNIRDYPQAICFINPNHPSFSHKIAWLESQFKYGLKIKLLYVDGEKKPVGFIEYVPGEFCWRAVQANGYMFIHCLYVNGNKFKNHGIGKTLLELVEQDAREMAGVAVLVSDASFMATRSLFLKNGYQVVAETGKDQLLVKQFRDAPLPALTNNKENLEKYTNLTILYSAQCPWVARFIDEVNPLLESYGIKADIIEIRTPGEAQQAPSAYGVFNLVYNGKVLADRYISVTRFKNIMDKEIRLRP